jgi:RNA polymerase sigma-B factor
MRPSRGDRGPAKPSLVLPVDGTGRSGDAGELLRLYCEWHDRELEDELLRHHDPLAVQLATRFSHRGEALDDLSQVARLALLAALRRYDPRRGVKFSSYAVPTIVGALKRHFRDRGWVVRPPRHIQEAYLAVSKAIEDLSAELGRWPTAGDVSERTGLALDEVIAGLEAGGRRRMLSLDRVEVAHGESAPQANLHDDGRQIAVLEDRSEASELVGLLPDREREVVVMSFFDDLSQSQIAARLGVSQPTVSRLRRQALSRLRRMATDATAA